MATLLVAIDGSEPSLRALKLAVKQAEGTMESRIHALFVHKPIDVAGKVQVFVSEERMRQMAAEQSKWILDAVEEQLRTTTVPHTIEMREGDPAETIARQAEELGCDAIVMGSRGMGRIAGLVLGSVANKVVHLTSLPVTLVK
jgi:nucleotide-binding universal stress UspA family protein